MNADNAKQYLPLVQALAAGKTVQLKSGSSWIDMTEVEFMADPEQYRVKPEPRRVRVWVNRNTGEVGDKYTGPLPRAQKCGQSSKVGTLRNFSKFCRPYRL